MMDFAQCYISPTLSFFKNDFKNRWGLSDYHDIYQPAIFFGMYGDIDLQYFQQHKGDKMVIWGGADMSANSLQTYKQESKKGNVYTWAYPGGMSNILASHNIAHKQIYLDIKDYSNFTPTPLGDKIYLYRGIHGNRQNYFQFDDVYQPLCNAFGKDSIIFANHLPLEELIETVYKQCFVYVKPNPKGGTTAMFEFAHMGIRTIGKNHKGLDFFSHYNDIEHLIELVKIEAENKGKTRPDVAESVKGIFIDERWLTLNFWKN